MIQEDKQLLLQDLCARLPYGVIVSPIDCGKAKLIGFKDKIVTITKREAKQMLDTILREGGEQ